MANKKRLISADDFKKAFYVDDDCDEIRFGVDGKVFVDFKAVQRAIDEAPTVDAVVLPCKIGDDVYIIPSKVNFDLNVLANHKENNRVYHQKVAEIVFNQNGWYMRGSLDKEYGTDRILVDRFYNELWFLTEKEAEAVLAKMDGGNEDV